MKRRCYIAAGSIDKLFLYSSELLLQLAFFPIINKFELTVRLTINNYIQSIFLSKSKCNIIACLISHYNKISKSGTYFYCYAIVTVISTNQQLTNAIKVNYWIARGS